MIKQFTILLKKEFTESIRNFKWVWIPLVFILLGIMQPVSSYFLPDILEKFGGLPEGVLESIPLPTASQVLVETLGQFSQVGFLVIVLAFMGVVAVEKNSGTQIMILVKPVSYSAYLVSKWVHMSLLAISSFFVGYLFAFYYTNELIGSVAIGNALKAGLVYGLWILFLATLILFFSAVSRSTAVVAFLTFGIIVSLSLLSSLVPKLMPWSPGMLSKHSQQLLMTGEPKDHFWLAVACTLLLIVFLVQTAIFFLKKQETAIHTT